MVGIARLAFPTINGQYTHDAANNFILGVHRVLKSTFNPIDDSGLGMSELLRSSKDPVNPSAISKIKSTDTAIIATVFRKSAEEAATASAAAGKEIPPAITTRADALDAVDRQNNLTQAVIGAKEGATEAITERVGARVTDAVLRNVDGQDFKSVDEYELVDVVAAVMQAAERPRIKNIREKLTDVIGFNFDWRIRSGDNMAVLRARAACLAAYGVAIDETQVATIVLGEADDASLEPWGREIATEMAKLRVKYPFDHRHDAVSVADIMTHLAVADGVRRMTAAPAPKTATAVAHSAESTAVQRLIFNEDTDDEGTAAAAEGYRSESSEETARPRRARSKKRGGAQGRSKSRGRREEHTAANNPCRHCRKWERRSRHPHATEANCFWNKKWKGFRPQWVCRKMDVRYKARDEFPAELGGYESSDNETSSGNE